MKKAFRILLAFLAMAILASLLLIIPLTVSGNEIPFTGAAAEYYENLLAQGFTQDYAYSLTSLHLLHPNWVFSPLLITQTNSDYTWNYIIQKETEKPTTNLVSANQAYKDYWHEKNKELYDAGYYQPSADTVMYFMDPRNFLNEADIFQFYNLSLGAPHSVEEVEAVLSGSFMENTMLQNGKTYAQYLIEIGDEIGIDAVYLAAKLRQEQGSEGLSPIISGQCGDKLWEFYSEQKQYTDGESPSPIKPPTDGETEDELKSLNGLYNPFNVNATGNGVFQIYKKAMQYAQQGSPSMSEAWGGSPAWDTDWKGIYGGALFIKQKYVDRHQSTVYLQKFDVDGRNPSGNFKNQYMQNIAGALSEGRNFYLAFATNDTLDTACQFLIPVYSGMPTQVSRDPANGTCARFAASTANFTTSASITEPQRLRAENQPIYGEITVAAGNPLILAGEFNHSYGVTELEYSIDGGTWISCARSEILDLKISENLPEWGEHQLLLRGEAAYDADNAGKRLNRYFLCAVMQLHILPPPSHTLTVQDGDKISELTHYEGDTVTLPVNEDPSFAGWIGSDGTVLPSGGEIVIREDVSYAALFLDYQVLEGAAISLNEETPHLRFSAILPNDQFEQLGEHVVFTAQIIQSGATTPVTVHSAKAVTGASGKVWRMITADTAPISLSQRAQSAEAVFSLQILYSDGTTKTFLANGSASSRSILQVAQAALNDFKHPYSTQTIGYLRSITNTERTPIS